ncbi:MAG: TRAP transporter small permease subunit [Pseudomonadota bacterium]
MRGLAASLSTAINRGIEALVAILMLALVLDVWLGVADRYYFGWQLPWPETLARYLMIWASMLAISSGIARRAHIRLVGVVGRLPLPLRQTILIGMDLLALALFLYVAWFGVGFAAGGANRQAMIFGATLLPFYAAIPTAATIAAVQMSLVLIRDLGGHLDTPVETENPSC